MWDALRRDVRQSFRSLRRAPAFSATVIVTLTLAIGAAAAAASLLNAVAWRHLPVPHPEQLVALSAVDPRGNEDGYFYGDTFNAYRAAQRSFAQLSMYGAGRLWRLETRAETYRDIWSETVSPEYFSLVGARPSAGRFFDAGDDRVVVITEHFRRRVFGSETGVGETVTLDALPVTVIGVAAEDFHGLQIEGPPDIIVPFALTRAANGDAASPLRSGTLVGRLAPGVSIGAARAELATQWPSIQDATLPAALSGAERQALLRQRLDVAPLASGFSGLRDRYGSTLWLLLALTGITLAIACANLAGLALARSLARRHEVAIRLALGGSVRRVFWQLVIDGWLLSAAALVGAIPLAWALVRLVAPSFLALRPMSLRITPDAAVVAATALLTVFIGFAIGVVSAWQLVAGRVDDTVRSGRGVFASFRRLGRGLLVAQVALSMMLVVGAGLFTATLAHLRANDTSLQSQRIFFSRSFREPGDHHLLPPDYYRNLVTGLAQMPGADGAALAVYYPTYFRVKGRVPADYQYMRADGMSPLDQTVMTDYVSPGFFDLFRFQRLQGRDVSWDDGLDKPAVALLSASLARMLFPGEDAVGRHFRVAGPQGREIEVIGVVADGPYVRLNDPRPLVVFRPIMQEVARAQFPLAYVRGVGDTATLRAEYTRVVESLGHRALRDFFISTSEWMDDVLVEERFAATLATCAAAFTLLLACIGVYGLLAYSVAARIREIGVRLALGAERSRILRMVLRDGLAIGVPGVLIGAPCAWAAARLVRAQLYGVAPGDPRTLLIAAATLLATVLAASLVPALRASSVAPVEALREE